MSGPRRAALLLVAGLLVVGSAAGAQPALLERNNAPLVPEGVPDTHFHVETASLVLPPGDDNCPEGCVFVSYGNPGGSLMRGKLSCLGKPGCMKAVALSPPAGTISGIGGTPVAGVCQGGTTADEFVFGWTDTNLVRAFDGSVLFVRAGKRFFADPAAGCAKDEIPLNLVYRSADGGEQWQSQTLDPAAPGEPVYLKGLDRFETYADPHSKTIYFSGGAGTGPKGINTSVLWASTDNGLTWKKRGEPLLGKFGAYPPLYMASTPNRLYMAVCADDVYVSGNPDVRPILGWSEDQGKSWEISEGSALDDFRCFRADSAVLPGGYDSNLSTVTLAPVKTGAGDVDVVRLAFPHRTETGRAVLTVVNVTVGKSGVMKVEETLTVEPAKNASVIHSNFIRTDRFEMKDGALGSDTAVLWWLEAGDPQTSTPAKITAKFRVVSGPKGWTKPRQLSFRDRNRPPGSPVSWEPQMRPDLAGWGGDYNNGSFYLDSTKNPATLNFLATWPQSDGKGAVPRFTVHYNVVSVVPKPMLQGPDLVFVIPKPQFIDDPLEPPCASCPPETCGGCPAAELVVHSALAGPMRFELRDERTRRLVGAFTANVSAGVNSFRIGPRRPGRAGAYRVTARPLGVPGARPVTFRVAAPEPLRERPPVRLTRTSRPDSPETSRPPG